MTIFGIHNTHKKHTQKSSFSYTLSEFSDVTAYMRVITLHSTISSLSSWGETQTFSFYEEESAPR